MSSTSVDGLDGRLTLGTVTAARGQPIEVPITLDVEVPVRGIQINLTYDGTLLRSGVVERGPGLPEGWPVFSNEPVPGDSRTVTLSLDGGDFLPGKEPILLARFNVSANAPNADLPVSIALSHIADGDSNSLTLEIVNGTVKITGILPR